MRSLWLVLVVMMGCAPQLVTTVNYKLNVPRSGSTGEAAIVVEEPIETPAVNYFGSQSMLRRELVYAGHDGTTIFLLYREYVTGLVRDGYRQEVVYDLSESKEIQFGPWQITVTKATNSAIEFTVLSDRGLSVKSAKNKKPAKSGSSSDFKF